MFFLVFYRNEEHIAFILCTTCTICEVGCSFSYLEFEFDEVLDLLGVLLLERLAKSKDCVHLEFVR